MRPPRGSTVSAIGRRWAESALEIAEYAKTCWVKMAGKRILVPTECSRLAAISANRNGPTSR